MLCVKSPSLFGMLKKGRILMHGSFCGFCFCLAFLFQSFLMVLVYSLVLNSRLWIFPQSSLSSAEKILREVSSVKVEVSLNVQLKLEV